MQGFYLLVTSLVLTNLGDVTVALLGDAKARPYERVGDWDLLLQTEEPSLPCSCSLHTKPDDCVNTHGYVSAFEKCSITQANMRRASADMKGPNNTKGQGSSKQTDPKSQKRQSDTPHESDSPRDLEEVLHSWGIGQLEDLATMAAEEALSEAQVEAFRAAFNLFAISSCGIIDAAGLSSSLETVDIKLSPQETEACLQMADYDGDGEVGFQDFLSLMTDSQKFTTCMKVEPPDPSQVVVVIDTVFYNALNKMLNAGLIPSAATEEIIRYYHKKSLRHIWRVAPQAVKDRGHLISYYAKGAHLIGLQHKQLMKYIIPHAPSTSPYSKQPSLNVTPNFNLSKKLLKKNTPVATETQSAKTWKTVEIEEHIRRLSIKHPGKETKDMITPVKIKVELQVRDRLRLTYDDIDQIQIKSKDGLNSYLKTLTQYKQRDAWNSWGSLQAYRRSLGFEAFPNTFTTYTWSWSGCKNMLQPQDLQERWDVAAHPASLVTSGLQ